MAELERELRGVGRRIEWPATPDLRTQVRAAVAREPERARPFPWRRALVVALAVLIVAIAAVFAVPSARTAILRWLGLEHVQVVRVHQLPATRRLAATDLGTRTTLAGAARRIGFTPLLPRHGKPTSVYFHLGPTNRVTLVYGSVARPRLLLTEFRGIGTASYAEKLVGPGTTVERVRVGDDPGLWISGEPHALYYEVPDTRIPETYVNEPLLAGNTLVWQRGQRTLRLEGKLSKSEALSIAKSVG